MEAKNAKKASKKKKKDAGKVQNRSDVPKLTVSKNKGYLKIRHFIHLNCLSYVFLLHV